MEKRSIVKWGFFLPVFEKKGIIKIVFREKKVLLQLVFTHIKFLKNIQTNEEA